MYFGREQKNYGQAGHWNKNSGRRKALHVGSNAMTELNDIKLENIDPEDIGDILVRLEKSFGIKYSDTAFKKAKTFGDICEVIERYINLEHQDTCTTQQAFYKVRNAISQTLQIDERSIGLATELKDLFPRKYRRRNIKRLQQQLGIKLDILRMKEWLIWTVFAGFVFSFIAFFFDWRIALSGIAFFCLFSKAASLSSKELEILTVQQLTEKIARDNYLAVRRKKGTINNNEVFKIIQDTFSADLGLDKSLLTKDASLGWN